MICKDCREAGGFNADANRRGEHVVNALADIAREMARECHARCKGCDCQHRIGRLSVAASETKVSPEEPAAEEVSSDDTD